MVSSSLRLAMLLSRAPILRTASSSLASRVQSEILSPFLRDEHTHPQMWSEKRSKSSPMTARIVKSQTSANDCLSLRLTTHLPPLMFAWSSHAGRICSWKRW
eukprot:Amastigsp_a178791_103.p6 type:complete len:102 gc:universal Amastigsp_a178791_103:591-286(-)